MPQGNGAGIAFDASTGEIRGNLIACNSTMFGEAGGIMLQGNAIPGESEIEVIVANNAIVGNWASGQDAKGGGIHTHATGPWEIVGNTIVANEGYLGGGIQSNGYTQHSVYVWNNIIARNTEYGVDGFFPPYGTMDVHAGYNDLWGNEYDGYSNCPPGQVGEGDLDPPLDPKFTELASGTWAAEATFDGTYSEIEASEVTWPINEFEGLIIDVNTEGAANRRWFGIVSNTTDTIRVLGDATDLADDEDIPFSIMDWHIQDDSPCIEAGTATFEAEDESSHSSPDSDIDGCHRPFDGDGQSGAQHDIGCHEYAYSVWAGPAVGWNLMSLPLSPTYPSPEEVFADLVDLGSTIPNNLYNYTPGSGPGAGYHIYPSAQFTQMEVGEGYWLRLTNVPDQTTNTTVGAIFVDPQSIALSDGWNMIGMPLNAAELWSGCAVTDGTETKSIADAGPAGWIQTLIYYYTPTGYESVKPDGTGDDDSLRPWLGYWLLAYQPGLTLLVPQPPGERLGGGFDAERDGGGRDSGWSSKVVFTVETDEGELPDWTMTFGLDSSATDYFDNDYDAFAPPANPDVEVRMVSYIGGDPEGYATCDVRDGSGTGSIAEMWQYVDILVPGAGRTEQHDVVLTWDITDAGDFDYYLYDTTNQEGIWLDEEESYELTTTGTFGASLLLQAWNPE